jgi:mannose-1-phosphate guanylyltransferase / mannose-6-phosphate isomerase
MIEAMQTHAPEILQACRRALNDAVEDLDFVQLGAAYDEATSISLDCAIAEKVEDIRCVPLTTPWSEVGSWSAVWNLMTKDEAGNVAHGGGKVMQADTKDPTPTAIMAASLSLGSRTLWWWLRGCRVGSLKGAR